MIPGNRPSAKVTGNIIKARLCKPFTGQTLVSTIHNHLQNPRYSLKPIPKSNTEDNKRKMKSFFKLSSLLTCLSIGLLLALALAAPAGRRNIAALTSLLQSTTTGPGTPLFSGTGARVVQRTQNTRKQHASLLVKRILSEGALYGIIFVVIGVVVIACLAVIFFTTR